MAESGRLVSPFPWHTIPRTNGASGSQHAQLLRWFRRSIHLDRVASSMGSLLSGTVEFSAETVHPSAEEALLAGLYGPVCFKTIEGWRFDLFLESALILVALRRVFGKPVGGIALNATADPSLNGAFGALVFEGLRRSGSEAGLFLQTSRENADSAPDTRTVGHSNGPFVHRFFLKANVDQQGYRLCIRTTAGHLPLLSEHQPPHQLLDQLGTLPLSLPVVVAQAQVARDVLAQLAVGDAWLPREGWLLDPQKDGQAWLVPPSGERGQGVWRASNGTLKLEAKVGNFPWDIDMIENPDPKTHEPAVVSVQTSDLANAALEAPIVVRVELGAVTVSARKWAQLQPGDVLTTSQRLLTPATLRVAGQQVATGELVNVEGELGIRILSIDTHD